MKVIHNRIDLALVSTKPEEVVDIGEMGFDRADLCVELVGGGSVTIEGSEKEDGTFDDYSLTVTVPEGGFYRGRIPMDMPKYIRLAADNGAKLSVRA